ncbi:hypothetical protein [Streptomyces fragilis]|uniref:Uncharacterized protein n=1 Tax=Streptomyces fragilis TaxID=67301 RepID=A0ABV2YJB2_9ACTN|nr:hypothetical protein [Streptomyces fragilis]
MTTVSDTTASTSTTVRSQADGAELADTSAFDTTPYIMGGTAFLDARGGVRGVVGTGVCDGPPPGCTERP